MAKKDKTSKLPKKVAGVKVPKDLRKSAKSALKLAQNPIAREVISAALVAGAAALTKQRSEKAAPEPKGKTNPDIGTMIAQGVAAFISGLGKPIEKKSESPKPEAAGDRPKAGSRPRSS